jgi:hypothetical protein
MTKLGDDLATLGTLEDLQLDYFEDFAAAASFLEQTNQIWNFTSKPLDTQVEVDRDNARDYVEPMADTLCDHPSL